ncbi:hypothetical protein BGZ61DRAFT_128616 [Ilyonectria robusta]|uniref:uncharacterized protein n=1 Tax=Ilyonectria robusta TaxID=1079257 RepID=UPI001E8E9328|nr:uncharacterized protein BGZ61DRAFT_128616 [Ilyonectria robusta]KAH8734716.1 hypothetical protein BGZ61DRAFT_128616 [Ilyonectria robusta]
MEAALRVSLGLAGGLALLLRNSWDSNGTRTQDSLRQLRGGGASRHSFFGLQVRLLVRLRPPSRIRRTCTSSFVRERRGPYGHSVVYLLDSSRELIPEPADRVAGVLTDHKPSRPGPGSAKKKKIPALVWRVVIRWGAVSRRLAEAAIGTGRRCVQSAQAENVMNQNGGMGVCDCLTSQHGLRIVAQLFAYPELDGV